jgi:hypothetical protein
MNGLQLFHPVEREHQLITLHRQCCHATNLPTARTLLRPHWTNTVVIEFLTS